MRDRGQWPLWSDRPQSAVDAPAPALGGAAARGGSGGPDSLGLVVEDPRGALAQPRLVVGLALIVGGVVWAIARGLEFYGVAPAHIAYDVDQPPLLLVLVGAWLLYRGRRR
jgi:hypothetical protein